MPELLVILGAEASLLIVVAAMTLHARRMDVLSGRSFERSVVSPTGTRHPQPGRRHARDLLGLIRRWIRVAATGRSNLLRQPDLARRLRSVLQTRPQTPSWLMTRSRRPDTLVAEGSVILNASRNAGAHG